MKKCGDYCLAIILMLAIGCKKSNSGGGGNPPPGGGPPTPPTDPPIENTIGFFLDSWTPKNFTVPAYTDTTVPSAAANIIVTIDASKIITKVPGPVFAQNANIWMSQMVTEPTLINH